MCIRDRLNTSGSYSTCARQTVLQRNCSTLGLPAREDITVIVAKALSQVSHEFPLPYFCLSISNISDQHRLLSAGFYGVILPPRLEVHGKKRSADMKPCPFLLPSLPSPFPLPVIALLQKNSDNQVCIDTNIGRATLRCGISSVVLGSRAGQGTAGMSYFQS